MQHSLFQVAATTANLAEAAAQGAAADMAASQGAAADAAAAAPEGHGVTAGEAAGSDGSQGTAADTAADDQGVAAHATADATARQRYENLNHDCQVVIGALDGSLRRSLQAALQRHGVPPGSSRDGSGSSSDGRGSSSNTGGSSSSSTGSSSNTGSSSGSIAMLSSSGSASCSQKEELCAVLAAAKGAADSERILEEGGEFGEGSWVVNSEVLRQVGEHLQRVWQLEQPADEQTAVGLRLAAAAALRSCANLSCTDLSSASEADCRGKKRRWAREGRLGQIADEVALAEMRHAVLLPWICS